MVAAVRNAREADGADARVERGNRDTLYYDGQCPLCAAEIEALAEARGASLCLIDIHDTAVRADASNGPGVACNAEPVPPAASVDADGSFSADGMAETRHNPSVDDLLRTLHLQRADGSWLTGADANVAAWETTRRGRLLRALRWPVFRPFVDFGYRIWALWRYRRLYGRQFVAERHAPRPNGD